MLRKALRVVAAFSAVLVAFGYLMYVRNPPPTVSPVSTAEAAIPGKPYVVKLHAKWCPVCMTTKGVWSQIEDTYSARVHLVVLDFTNQANTDASQAEAKRLGLEKVFDEYAGWTGTVLVLDGHTKEVTASINGSRDFAEYRAAIDTALTTRHSSARRIPIQLVRTSNEAPDFR
jgi:thiol-disulfide isomerase/thioredoxin